MADNGKGGGYGKPPKHSQWKPGQSGNPGGRKKGARGLKTDLATELDAKHTIQINKQAVTGTRQQLMIRTLAIRAASGDLKATQLLAPLILQVLGAEDRSNAKETLSKFDQALLNQLLDNVGDDDEPAGADDGDDALPANDDDPEG